MSIATEPIAQGIADEVRSMMARKRITGKSVAARLGITEMAFSRRARGEVEFSASEIVLVAQALDCPVDDLLPQMDSNHQHFDYQFDHEADYWFHADQYALAA